MPIRWRLVGPLLLVSALFIVVGSPASPVATAAPAHAQFQAPAAERPAWHALPLVDARTGATFTLADLAGKTVYVEPMATWCTNCRQQMGVIRDQLVGQVDPAQVAFVGLSVETTLPPERLAAYVDTHAFGWTFAVMTPELLQELRDTFGLTVANPPAIPHFVIGPDGTTSGLSTGFHSVDRLLEELTAAGGMAQ
jgi:thiol-disulfide isomerase/thioredoxin